MPSGDKPDAPDPKVTAAEQLNLNKKTSAFEAKQNRYDMSNPFGSVSWKNLGTEENPRWVQNTKLSPQQQRLYNSQLGTQNYMAWKANKMLPSATWALSKGGYNAAGALGALQKQGVMGGDLATRKHVEDALMARLNPSLMQDEEALRTRLANQGLQYGTEAYGNAMRDMNQRVNDARLGVVAQGGQEMQLAQNLDLNRRNQIMEEATGRQAADAASRNQRLAELSAMIQGGGSINMPTYQGAQNVSTGSAPDLGALVNSNYQGKVASNNANTASNNALMAELLKTGVTYATKK